VTEEPVHPVLAASETVLFANAPRVIRWNPLLRPLLRRRIHRMAVRRQAEWDAER
jgi:hypothetical protein